MQRVRKHLSFANVMSVIAVCIALGGTAIAATKINGKQIKKASIAGSKLKNDTVTGQQIAESSLKLGTVTACPAAAPNRANNLCYASFGGLNTDWDVDERDCAGKGLRIPTIGEALLVTNATNTGDNYIWTEAFPGSGTTRIGVRTNDPTFSRIASTAKGGAADFGFICVATPA